MKVWKEGVNTIIGADFNARTGREEGEVKGGDVEEERERRKKFEG